MQVSAPGPCLAALVKLTPIGGTWTYWAVVSEPDVRAFHALYQRNYQPITRYLLRRTASPEDAADAVAETFLTAWRRIDVVPAGEEGTMWLYATARHVLHNQRRSSGRRRRLLDRIRHQPALLMDEQPDADVVADAFSRLRSGDQEVLALIAWDGLTHRQVGSVLGCSENAAKLRAARSRERFAAELSKLGVRRSETDRTATQTGLESAAHIGGANE